MKNMKIKRHLFPTVILGGFLLFGLMSPAFVGASIIVTGTNVPDPNTGWGIIVTGTNVPDPAYPTCSTCNDNDNDDDNNQIVTTTTPIHPPCHTPSCSTAAIITPQATTTTTHPECHYPPCTTTTTCPSCTTTTTTICPSPSVDISVAPPSVPYNGSAVLHWTSAYANYCTASASPYNYQWNSGVNLNGDKSINNLTQTTTFSITCTGNCGTASDSAMVYVQAPPPPTRYACNTYTWQCVVDSSGPYTSLSTCQANCQSPFDFSLSNSGNIVVTKPTSGSITGSNTITANLISGTAQSVSFSQSGLPYGVSASYLSSCYPTCSKTNTLTVNSSASVGTFPITVTATGGGITRTTNYNLIVQDSYIGDLYASCYTSPNPAQINQTVTFYSNVSGGTGNYTYYWSGATYGNNSYSQKTFSSYDNYTAYLTVYDSQSRSASTSCGVNIQSQTTAPTLNLWADKYTLTQGESTYLRWTSTNANYCVASTGWSGNKSTSGYESVSPNSDTTYSLTCYGDGGQVSRSVTIYVTSTGTNLNLTKLGRNLSAGDRVYSKVIRITQGDVTEFHLTVTAGSNKDLYNVVVKDVLPLVLNYMSGTTKIDGVVQPDTMTTTGLSLGTIYKGTTKTIVFQALSLSPGAYLTYTNTAEVTADNENKITDSASITYGLVAGAATVKTGAKDSLLISLIVSLVLSLIIWYYLKFNPKGKLAFVAIESKVRDFSLAYLRRKMIHQNRN